MKPSVIKIPVDTIIDWESFHDVFQTALGFPSFYGRNMNAFSKSATLSISEIGARNSTLH